MKDTKLKYAEDIQMTNLVKFKIHLTHAKQKDNFMHQNNKMTNFNIGENKAV